MSLGKSGKDKYGEMVGDLFSLGFRVGMLTLGPVLVVIATCLISFCLYVGTTSVLPLYGAGLIYYASTIFTIFLGINILFNYTLCVFTNPGTHDSKPFLQLVEMARENEDLKLFHRKPANDRSFCSNSEGIELRKRVDKAEATDSPKYGSKTINAEDVSFFDSEGEDDDPFGWEFCSKSNSPKPPRAHFDRVTNKLVLNMDHYCPWMFNVVGFLNYRYFVLFLLWLWVGCLFAIFVTLAPFLSIQKEKSILGLNVPVSEAENINIMFVICCSVEIAISFLFFWHMYLILTGQTTIEYYINGSRRRRNLARGQVFLNPYDMGRKKNWEHIMGDMNPLLAIMPSRRDPPGLPWPDFELLYSCRKGIHAV